ncbi:MAG: molybdate ABC transporter substrate-binding protein [Ornithinibacter sp.]
MRRPLALVLTTATLLLVAGCGSDASTDSSSAATGSAAVSAGEGDVALTVFAAASLKKTFTEIGQQFEASHPGTTVSFNFAGSSDLVTQIQQGAPADVFASADTKNMAKATGDALVQGSPVDFATNTLQIAVPPGNPGKVTSLKDLTNPSLNVVICAAEVPCGSATKKVEAAAGITLTPRSEESSVTDVLNKVQTGEADAGLVYVTDVSGAGDKVEGIAFEESSAAVNRYPIGALKTSKNLTLAQEFLAMVAGPEGAAVLRAAGFGAP